MACWCRRRTPIRWLLRFSIWPMIPSELSGWDSKEGACIAERFTLERKILETEELCLSLLERPAPLSPAHA